jgi:hypothetical protein
MMNTGALARMNQALSASRGGTLPVSGLARCLRGEAALLAALPPRYTQVLEDILGRLESASLFGEESCSFSQRDLLDALGHWLDQARRASTAAEPEQIKSE